MSPRSAETNEQMREQSRERILAAALEVFSEKGFHNATISDITAHAGVSRGLATYYFPGKHDLMEHLLTRYLNGLLALVDVTGTPDERLAAIIDGILGAAWKTLPEQRMALSVMTHPSTHPLFAQIESGQHKQLSMFEDRLRGLFAGRGAIDPDLEEVMFRSIAEGIIFKLIVYRDQYPLERVRARLYEMYELPSPRIALVEDNPAPVSRLRAIGHSLDR